LLIGDRLAVKGTQLIEFQQGIMNFIVNPKSRFIGGILCLGGTIRLLISLEAEMANGK